MTPIKTLIRGKVEDTYYSPDMPELYAKRRHLLFVYGTLKKGFMRHELLKQKKAMFVGDGWTDGDYFNMEYTTGQHPYPVILPCHPTNGAKIHGEVYLVPPAAIVNCDFYESNGSYYDRKTLKINITNANNPDAPLSVDCWVYEGNRAYWATVKTKKKLNQVETLVRKKDGKKYFTFMKKHTNGKPNAPLRSL